MLGFFYSFWCARIFSLLMAKFLDLPLLLAEFQELMTKQRERMSSGMNPMYPSVYLQRPTVYSLYAKASLSTTRSVGLNQKWPIHRRVHPLFQNVVLIAAPGELHQGSLNSTGLQLLHQKTSISTFPGVSAANCIILRSTRLC